MVIRELGDAEAVQQRTPEAASKLDELMASAWVIVHRAPSVQSTSMIAFPPHRLDEPVIRLTPLACRALNADFDGDQIAVLLPVTDAGQREAGELANGLPDCKEVSQSLARMAVIATICHTGRTATT